MSSGPPNALAKINRQLGAYADDPTWQRLWLNLESQRWRSLAVVPTGDSSSIEYVHALAAVAWRQRSTPVIVADLGRIGLQALAEARGELRRRVDNGERVLIGMHSIEVNPTSAAIAREADRALLFVILGRTTRSQVRNAVRELGAQRYLGSILIRANGT